MIAKVLPETVVGPVERGSRYLAEPPVLVANTSPQWECQANEGSFFATSRFQESEDRQYEIKLEYLDATASRTGAEKFTMIIKRNGDAIAWMENWVDPMPGSLDSVGITGSTLTAAGTALLNDPFDPTVFPGGATFGSARIEPFTLQASCE